jgi:antitoxin HicB
MKYYAKLTKQPEGFLVEFPDLSGCFTEGRTREIALKNASEAMNGWLADSCDRNLNIPHPTVRNGRNYAPVDVELPIAFAICIRRSRARLGMTQSQAAKKLGVSQQAYAKLEAADTANPSLLTIQKLAKVLELTVDFKIAS